MSKKRTRIGRPNLGEQIFEDEKDMTVGDNFSLPKSLKEEFNYWINKKNYNKSKVLRDFYERFYNGEKIQIEKYKIKEEFPKVENDEVVRDGFKLPKSLKDNFNEKCKKGNYNKSAVIRDFYEKFCIIERHKDKKGYQLC